MFRDTRQAVTRVSHCAKPLELDDKLRNPSLPIADFATKCRLGRQGHQVLICRAHPPIISRNIAQPKRQIMNATARSYISVRAVAMAFSMGIVVEEMNKWK
jgi:hypothetical protein